MINWQSLPRLFAPARLALPLLLLAGCVHYHAQPLNPADTAAALSARSLSDDGLRHFLAKNLGREPAPWPPPAWDFETLSWVAFYYQPSLEVARAQWDAARAAARTASARPNPALTVTPGYDTSVTGGVSPWFPSVDLDWLVETANKRAHRREVARFTAEAARLDVLAAAWQVRSELRQALIELSAAEHRQALLDVQATVQRQIMVLFDQRLQAGAVSAFEISATRTALVKAEAAAAEAARQIPAARNRVAQALGVPAAALDGVPFADLLAAPSPALAADELAAARRQSLRSRADVLGALARYEASQAALQLAVAGQYPDLHLGPGYQYDLGENKWSLALGLELPVFHHNEGPIAEAEARRREAAAQFLATQAHAIAEIDGAAAAQATAAGQLVHLRLLRAELKKQAELMRARLAAGGAGQVELQNAQVELTSGELALLDAEVSAAQAAGQLEDALQVPFPHLAAVASLRSSASQSPLP